MRKLIPHKYFQFCLLSCVASSAWGASADPGAEPEPLPRNSFERYFGLYKASAENDDWTRHFRVGALIGLNINANFKTSGSFNISGNNIGDGIYDDGYVRPDESGDPNNTSYWGYDNRAAQYNAAANTLTMHSGTSYSTIGSNDGDADCGATVGFDLAYGGNFWYWRHVRIGWDLGFGLLPIAISDQMATRASVTQNAYAFDTSALGNFFPSSSSYHADSSGQGRMIPTAYTSSTSTLSGGDTKLTGTRKLDVTLYALRLGPTFYGDVFENIAISFGAGPAIGIVDGSYKYDETITAGGVSSRNFGSFSQTEVVFGGYVNAMLMYHFMDNNRNADVYIGAQYMPMSDATFSSGGREGRLNLSGQVYLSVGLNWPF